MRRARRPIAALAAAVLALGAVAVVVLLLDPQGPQQAHTEPRAARAAPLERADGRADAELARDPSNERVSVNGGAIDAQEPAPPAAVVEPHRIRGIVVDVQGQPLVGVGVGVREGGDAGVLGMTGPDGRFELERETLGVMLVAASREVVGLNESFVDETSAAGEHMLVAARAVRIAGRVVDDQRVALDDAEVRVDVELSAFARVGLPLGRFRPLAWTARSGYDGTFVTDPLPGLAHGLRLATSHSACWADYRDLAPDLDEDLDGDRLDVGDVVLLAKARSNLVLEGRVLHENGDPAVGAPVFLSSELRTESGPDGFYALPIEEPGAVDVRAPLVAVEPGYAAAIHPQFGQYLRENADALGPIDLFLGGPTLSLAGRVVDADGRPCAGWRVVLPDESHVSLWDVPPLTAEALAGARPSIVHTDEEGRFRLEGLADRAYAVRAWDPELLTTVRSDPVPAGTSDLVLRVPPDAVRELRGRVADTRGVPVAGARVELSRVTLELTYGTYTDQGPGTETDAQGRFAFARVPRHGMQLRVEGPGIFGEARAVERDAPDPLEIEVKRRLRFRVVDARAEDAADAIAVLDYLDEQVSVLVQEGQGSVTEERVALVDGRSHVLTVSEDAVTLVLYRGGAVIGQEPLDFIPDEVTVVQPGVH